MKGKSIRKTQISSSVQQFNTNTVKTVIRQIPKIIRHPLWQLQRKRPVELIAEVNRAGSKAPKTLAVT